MNKEKGKVVKAGLGYTIGNFFVKGLNFLTIPIFARLLSASDYGLYNTFLAYEGIFFSIIGLALQMSLKNAKYRYGKDYEQYVSSILLLQVLLLIGWFFVIVLFHKPIWNTIGYGYVLSCLLILHCTSSSILSLYNIHLSLNYSFKSYVYVTFFNAILNVVLSIALIMTFFQGERFLGRVIGTVTPLALLMCFICLSFWLKNAPKIRLDYWRFGISYSLPLIPHAISQVILNQFDRVMINEMKGAACAGIYSFAYNIFMIISVIMYSLDNVWSPWFYEKFKKKEEYLIKSRSTQYALGMLILTILIMLVSPELIFVLGTKEYHDAVYSVIPVCAGGYFLFLYSIPSQVEYYLGKTYYIAFGTAAAAIIKILLNLYFIPRYGYISAAYTTEFAYLLYFVLHYYIAKHLLRHSLYDGKKLFYFGSACIIISLSSVAALNWWLLRWGGVFLIVGYLIGYARKRRISLIDFVKAK